MFNVIVSIGMLAICLVLDLAIAEVGHEMTLFFGTPITSTGHVFVNSDIHVLEACCPTFTH